MENKESFISLNRYKVNETIIGKINKLESDDEKGLYDFKKLKQQLEKEKYVNYINKTNTSELL